MDPEQFTTLVEMLAGAAERVRDGSAINTVVLSGGVFNNYLLFEGLIAILEAKGFEVLTHSQLPAGDGCLSLGEQKSGVTYQRANIPLELRTILFYVPVPTIAGLALR